MNGGTPSWANVTDEDADMMSLSGRDDRGDGMGSGVWVVHGDKKNQRPSANPTGRA